MVQQSSTMATIDTRLNMVRNGKRKQLTYKRKQVSGEERKKKHINRPLSYHNLRALEKRIKKMTPVVWHKIQMNENSILPTPTFSV